MSVTDVTSSHSSFPSDSFRRQLRPDIFLLYGFLGWALLLVLQLVRLMLVDAPQRLAQMREAAVETYDIPGRRGSIYDYQGRPVAWTETRFDLVWKSRETTSPMKWSALADALKSVGVACPNSAPAGGERLVLKAELSPDDCLRLRPVLVRIPSLEIAGRYCRLTSTTAAGGLDIGRTEIRDGLEVGTSGLEKEFDEQLSPRLGRIQVMKDKRGQWILSSYQEQSGFSNGGDVYLPMSLGSRP